MTNPKTLRKKSPPEEVSEELVDEKPLPTIVESNNWMWLAIPAIGLLYFAYNKPVREKREVKPPPEPPTPPPVEQPARFGKPKLI